MSKHTPGEWISSGHAIMARIDGDWIEVGEARKTNIGVKLPWQANARLIAAAPDLLEALKAITKELEAPTMRLINSNRRGDQSLGSTLDWVRGLCAKAIAKSEEK